VDKSHFCTPIVDTSGEVKDIFPHAHSWAVPAKEASEVHCEVEERFRSRKLFMCHRGNLILEPVRGLAF
jgi:hypothetical protein